MLSRHRSFIFPCIVVITCCLLIGVTTQTSSARSVEFGQAIQMLQSQNESIKAARMETHQRASERLAARGAYFPKIELSGGYTRLDKPVEIDLNSIRTVMLQLHPTVPASRIPEFKQTIQDEEYWNLRAQATWPIFTGGRIVASNREADARWHEAHSRLISTESALISDLVERYFGLRLSEKVAEIRRKTLEGMRDHLFQAKKLEENGILSRSERLHAEVAFSEADRMLKQALRDRNIAASALSSIISSSEPIDAVSPLFILDALAPLATFKEKARKSSPLLKQLSATREVTKQIYNKEKASYYPKIFLFGTREVYKNDLTTLEPEWAVGVGMNLTLFDGLSRTSRVTAARYLTKRVEYQEQRAQRDIETLLEIRYNQVMNALEQFRSTDVALESAREYLRVRTRAFEEGYATSLDVVDAQLALSRVQIEKLTAAYSFDVALARLLEISGLSGDFEKYRTGSHSEVVL